MLATCCRYYARSRGQKSQYTFLPVSKENPAKRKGSQVCKPCKLFCHFSLANPSESRFFSVARLFTSGGAVASLPNTMPRRASLNLLFKSMVEVLQEKYIKIHQKDM